MTRRKPPGTPWESWIDRQVRQAQERGEFEDLPGTGEPIADLGQPHDENWWVKRKLRREGLTYMAPSIALRKAANDALEAALGARTEVEARRIITDINAKIRDANRRGVRGPAIMLIPHDVERVIRDWRAQHPGQAGGRGRPG